MAPNSPTNIGPKLPNPIDNSTAKCSCHVSLWRCWPLQTSRGPPRGKHIGLFRSHRGPPQGTTTGTVQKEAGREVVEKMLECFSILVFFSLFFSLLIHSSLFFSLSLSFAFLYSCHFDLILLFFLQSANRFAGYHSVSSAQCVSFCSTAYQAKKDIAMMVWHRSVNNRKYQKPLTNRKKTLTKKTSKQEHKE